jgi:pilus assembly protein CpaF
MADALELAVRARRNILVSGPAGSGRSTVLAALTRVADGERIVSVEEAEELDLGEGPWIALTGRGPTARAAVGHALRLRPERLVVGDVRGPEAFDLVSAMASGIDGVSLAVLAGSAAEGPERIKSLANLAPDAPSERTLAEAIARALHLVVHMGRGGDESRVLEIYDVAAGEPVFTFKPDGAGGRFVASGHVPAWAEGASPSVFRA